MKKFLKNKIPRVINIYRILKFQLKNKKIYKTKWGFKFIGNEKMAKGEFEVFETEIVRRLLKETEIFVNVGANIGYYCCHALDMNNYVIAFEPMPNNLYFLYKNIEINNWAEINVYPVALSNKSGITKIYGDNTGASIIKGWGNFEEEYSTIVPKFTLDELLKERFFNKKLLFLIDIEGSEFEMLEGSKSFINLEPSPIWIVEIVLESDILNKEFNFKRYMNTFEIFFKHGYNAFTIQEKLYPLSKDEILAMNKSSKNVPYNFLFKK